MDDIIPGLVLCDHRCRKAYLAMEGSGIVNVRNKATNTHKIPNGMFSENLTISVRCCSKLDIGDSEDLNNYKLRFYQSHLQPLQINIIIPYCQQIMDGNDYGL